MARRKGCRLAAAEKAGRPNGISPWETLAELIAHSGGPHDMVDFGMHTAAQGSRSSSSDVSISPKSSLSRQSTVKSSKDVGPQGCGGPTWQGSTAPPQDDRSPGGGGFTRAMSLNFADGGVGESRLGCLSGFRGTLASALLSPRRDFTSVRGGKPVLAAAPQRLLHELVTMYLRARRVYIARGTPLGVLEIISPIAAPSTATSTLSNRRCIDSVPACFSATST